MSGLGVAAGLDEISQHFFVGFPCFDSRLGFGRERTQIKPNSDLIPQNKLIYIRLLGD